MLELDITVPFDGKKLSLTLNWKSTIKYVSKSPNIDMAEEAFKSNMSMGLIGEDIENLSMVTSRWDFEGNSRSKAFCRLVLIWAQCLTIFCTTLW